jgi:hypothetical protein
MSADLSVAIDLEQPPPTANDRVGVWPLVIADMAARNQVGALRRASPTVQRARRAQGRLCRGTRPGRLFASGHLREGRQVRRFHSLFRRIDHHAVKLTGFMGCSWGVGCFFELPSNPQHPEFDELRCGTYGQEVNALTNARQLWKRNGDVPGDAPSIRQIDVGCDSHDPLLPRYLRAEFRWSHNEAAT